jgi:hypothetical protein
MLEEDAVMNGDDPTPQTAAAQVELRGQNMNEKTARELRSIIEQLESPISSDEVAHVTAAAAMRIRELWMELEAREADIEHLKQLQTSRRRSLISQSGADEPQHER